MISVNEFNSLELGKAIVEEKETDYRYKQVKIEILDYDLEKFLLAYNYRIQKGFEWVKELIELKPMRRSRLDEYKYSIIPKFKQPVELCLLDYKEDGVFRLYDLDPRYVVSKNGALVELESMELVPIKLETKVIKYPYYTKRVEEKLVHRVLAVTWIPNNDYVKYFIVDHINENKADYRLENLRWVTARTNTSRSSYSYIKAVDKRWMVMDVKRNKIYEFDSYSELGEFFKLPFRNLEARKAPYILETPSGLYIVEDRLNFTNWSLLNKINDYGYRYKLYNLKTKQVFRFKSLEDLHDKFNAIEPKIDKKIPYKNGFKRVKEFLSKYGWIIKEIGDKKIYNAHSEDKYKIEAKDLETGKIIVADSTREMITKLGGKRVNKSVIIFRLNGNRREGIPLEISGKRYLIRRSDKPWPELRESKKPKQKEVEVITDSGIKKFKSLREASRELNIARHKLSNLAQKLDDKIIIDLKNNFILDVSQFN